MTAAGVFTLLASLIVLLPRICLTALRRRWFVETSQCQGGGSAAGDAKEGKTRLGLGDVRTLQPQHNFIGCICYCVAHRGLCSHTDASSAAFPLLAVQLWSVFLIPAAGLLLTLLVLLAEVLYYRKAYKGGFELQWLLFACST